MTELQKQFLNTPVDDYLTLLKLADEINRDGSRGGLKIAVLGTYSTQYILSVLKAMLDCHGIAAEFYEGAYNGLLPEIYGEDSDLYAFNPEIVLILPYHTDVRTMPPLLADRKEVETEVAGGAEFLLSMAGRIHERVPNAHIFMSNIVLPYVSVLGNLEADYLFSQRSFLSMVNLELMALRPRYVTIVDVEALAGGIGKQNWFDESVYCLAKLGFSLKYTGQFCDLFCRQILALKGNVRKCLVLDLDNTLWGGEVGELGWDGILLDPNDAEGEAYLAFQEYLLSLKDRGILLAVCSKNDGNRAREPFEKNRHMKLELEDISCFVANWEDKARNIEQIARELNIGMDSMVFFDDSPAERELVRRFLPKVRVIEVPEDPALFVRALYEAAAFDWLQITPEDVTRSQTFVSEGKRKDLRLQFRDYGEYLESLGMEGSFAEISEEAAMERFVQLLNKTNQFNLVSNRYSGAQIESMAADDSFGLYAVSMADRFGNYGVIACVVLHFEDKVCDIVDWCMSCRVLKRGVEYFTMRKIADAAGEHGCTTITGHYMKTEKNGMVETLFSDLGFQLVGGREKQQDFILELSTDSNALWISKIKEVSQ